MKPGPSRVSMRAGAVILAAASFACGPRPHVEEPTQQSREGRSSVRLLTAPAAQADAPDPSSETMTPAYASPDNERPEYPAEALKAGCLEGTIPLRVYVGPDGNVASQKDIPGRPVPADACHVAFLGAVEAAVAHWRFAPAFRLTRASAAPAGIARWSQAPIAIYLDFEFHFDVVDGKGVVLTR
jgi:hypothetical protein